MEYNDIQEKAYAARKAEIENNQKNQMDRKRFKIDLAQEERNKISLKVSQEANEIARKSNVLSWVAIIISGVAVFTSIILSLL